MRNESLHAGVRARAGGARGVSRPMASSRARSEAAPRHRLPQRPRAPRFRPRRARDARRRGLLIPIRRGDGAAGSVHFAWAQALRSTSHTLPKLTLLGASSKRECRSCAHDGRRGDPAGLRDAGDPRRYVPGVIAEQPPRGGALDARERESQDRSSSHPRATRASTERRAAEGCLLRRECAPRVTGACAVAERAQFNGDGIWRFVLLLSTRSAGGRSGARDR